MNHPVTSSAVSVDEFERDMVRDPEPPVQPRTLRAVLWAAIVMGPLCWGLLLWWGLS